MTTTEPAYQTETDGHSPTYTVEEIEVHDNGTWFAVCEDGIAIEDFRDPEEARKYADDLNNWSPA